MAASRSLYRARQICTIHLPLLIIFILANNLRFKFVLCEEALGSLGYPAFLTWPHQYPSCALDW
jgi:hypothetical protein